MKIEGNTIEFKSVPAHFEKERTGIKNNTVRRVREFEKDIIMIVPLTHIRIRKTEGNEYFERRLSDISVWGDVMIFTWYGE